MSAVVDTISKITNLSPVKIALKKLKGIVTKKALQYVNENFSKDPFKALNYTREALKEASDEIYKAENELVVLKENLKEFDNIKRHKSNTDMNTFMKNSAWCDTIPRQHQLLGMISDCEEMEKIVIPEIHKNRHDIVKKATKSLTKSINTNQTKATQQLEKCKCQQTPCEMTDKAQLRCLHDYHLIMDAYQMDKTNLSTFLHYNDQLNTEINDLGIRVKKLHDIYQKMSSKIAEIDNFCAEIKKRKMNLQGFKLKN